MTPVASPVQDITNTKPAGRPFAREWNAICARYRALLEAAGIDPESDEPADQHTRGCPRARSAREDAMLEAERAARQAAIQAAIRAAIRAAIEATEETEATAAAAATVAAASASEFRQAAAHRGIRAIPRGRHALPLGDDPDAPARRPGKWGTRVRGQFSIEDPWWRDHLAAAKAAKAADPVAARTKQNDRWMAGNRRAELAAGSVHKPRGRAK